jgi:signal transduction histidine kinase
VGDRLELRRVFVNLISNGIKFTDAGQVNVRTDGEAHRMIVEIADTGIGIAPEDQRRIFEPFRQGKQKRSGHGLGLYLCRQIVQAHRGEIFLRSALGEGTTFRLDLPLS